MSYNIHIIERLERQITQLNDTVSQQGAEISELLVKLAAAEQERRHYEIEREVEAKRLAAAKADLVERMEMCPYYQSDPACRCVACRLRAAEQERDRLRDYETTFHQRVGELTRERDEARKELAAEREWRAKEAR